MLTKTSKHRDSKPTPKLRKPTMVALEKSWEQVMEFEALHSIPYFGGTMTAQIVEGRY